MPVEIPFPGGVYSGTTDLTQIQPTPLTSDQVANALGNLQVNSPGGVFGTDINSVVNLFNFTGGFEFQDPNFGGVNFTDGVGDNAVSIFPGAIYFAGGGYLSDGGAGIITSNYLSLNNLAVNNNVYAYEGISFMNTGYINLGFASGAKIFDDGNGGIQFGQINFSQYGDISGDTGLISGFSGINVSGTISAVAFETNYGQIYIPLVSTVSSATSGTVSFISNENISETLYLTGTSPNVTIPLPTNYAYPQEKFIVSKNAAVVSITGGTILSGATVTALTAGQRVGWQTTSTQTGWIRIQ